MGKWTYVKNKKTQPYELGHWSEKKKYEAVCLWLTGIPLTHVSVELNVPINTLRQWKISKWWQDTVKDIQSEDKQKLDAQLTKILDKTLEQMMDRLDSGEFLYDQKTGKLKRTPVKLRDATAAFNSVLDKRMLIRKEPTKIIEQASTASQLEELAKQFASFVNKTPPKESLEKVVNEFIDDTTVEQDPVTGEYYVKE